MYIDKLDDIVNKYNNIYHSTIKIKPVDVKSNTNVDSSKEINDKNSKFKIGDFVRISKYENIFAKGYTLNWSEEVFVILCCRHILLMILMEKKLLEILQKRIAKKQPKRNLGLKR